ncbi:epiplakin-like isoform X2 [Vidua chalybeata]|uniref:epiplakin-like isoform X2 n=1 Tax=Vidua chalybeata TaxID=81927 RepID=UPI0023A855A9|nr:epiplakin-like isoform X2 [Vidua chalybeata]
MAEERGAELGAAPERRREPVCRQRRSERSAARRGRWQPSWGAATAPRRGGAAAEGGGARGSGVCRRGGGGGRLHAQAPRAKLAAGGEQAWRARREPGSTGEGDGSSAEGPESGADAVAAPRDPRRGQGTARCATRSGEAARSRRSQEKLHGSTRKENLPSGVKTTLKTVIFFTETDGAFQGQMQDTQI